MLVIGRNIGKHPAKKTITMPVILFSPYRGSHRISRLLVISNTENVGNNTFGTRRMK